MLLFWLRQKIFKCSDQICLQIDETTGGKFAYQGKESAKKPWVLRKNIEGGLIRRVGKVTNIFIGDSL